MQEPVDGQRAGTDVPLAERLERDELIYFPVCPFSLPHGDDQQFLLSQHLARGPHKNISYDPATEKLRGIRIESPQQAERVKSLLADFSSNASRWLARVLPNYAAGWQRDLTTLRSEEEATRRLRLTARNDLVHVDAFPTRPTNGRRILRCFANINPTEPRVWVTSEPFSRLLERYGREVGLPTGSGIPWNRRLQDTVVRVFRPDQLRCSAYDAFMRRFHDFLKMNDSFQEHCPKRYWTFIPGSAWLVFSDSVSHAALRGRGAVEQTYFIPPEVLLMPAASPAACLQRASGRPVLNAA
jgi:hypothetical protein